MEIYVPVRIRLKLSYNELEGLCIILGRYRYEGGLQGRACAEWVIKKRMDIMRRLMDRRKAYNLTLGAVDALILSTVLNVAPITDEYEWALYDKIILRIDQLG